METNQVSIHLCKVFLAVQAEHDWITSKAVAAQASVSERTARSHLLRLSEIGLLDQTTVFAGYRYRISSPKDKAGHTMLNRIEHACAVFGLSQ